MFSGLCIWHNGKTVCSRPPEYYCCVDCIIVVFTLQPKSSEYSILQRINTPNAGNALTIKTVPTIILLSVISRIRHVRIGYNSTVLTVLGRGKKKKTPLSNNWSGVRRRTPRDNGYHCYNNMGTVNNRF